MVAIANAQSQDFAFWAAVAFIGPLQGFLNCLVFIRPRLMKWRRERQKKREKKRKEEQRHKEMWAAIDNTTASNNGTAEIISNSRMPFSVLPEKSRNKSIVKQSGFNPSTTSSIDRSSKTSRTESATDRYDESAGSTIIHPATPMPPMPELDDNEHTLEDSAGNVANDIICLPECEENPERDPEEKDMNTIFPSLI